MTLLAYILLFALALYTRRWWLATYLMAAPVPYTLSVMGWVGRWPYGGWEWWVAVWHVAVALCASYTVLEEGRERRALVVFGALVGTGLAALVLYGGTGRLIVDQNIYWTRTISTGLAAGIGVGVGGYLISFKNRGLGAMLVGLYFTGDVLANGLCRLHPFRPGWCINLAEDVAVGHLAVVLTGILACVGSQWLAQRNRALG